MQITQNLRFFVLFALKLKYFLASFIRSSHSAPAIEVDAIDAQ